MHSKRIVLTLFATLVSAVPFLPMIARASDQCTGNACGVVEMRWDPGAQRARFTNFGTRPVKVELRNWAAGNTIPLAPGESKHAWLQVFELPFHANYDR